MNKKKYSSGIITTIILVSMAVSALTVQAAPNRTVHGIVYINGSEAPDGTTVKLVFPDQTITNNTYVNGHYVMNFEEGNYEEGTFSVLYLGDWYPTTPPTVELGDSLDWDYSVDLYVTYTPPANNPPNTPYNPSPTGSGVSINADLSWSGGDPDSGDTVTYDVYYGTASDPPLVENNQSGTTYALDVLPYSSTRYWKIVAWDDNGASTTGPIWSFTTGAPAPPPNPPPIPPSSTNAAPNADASNSETTGIVGVSVTLDGSLSSDSDGSIVNYTWDFGDSSIGYGWITTHVFDDAITYDVTLTVTDDDGSTDDDTIQVVISAQANIPPSDPVVTGTGMGTKNTGYRYDAVSTDDDNDTIQYVFNWGDAQITTTDFLANGTATIQMHNWSSAGVYTIGVKAYDNETYSGTTSYVVLIDAWWVKHIGYLLDNDPDGVYDEFHSNATGEETVVEQLENGSYLIDDDGDDVWDYGYDKETDTLWVYSEATEEDYTLWYMLLLGVIIVIIILLVIAMAMRRKQKSKQQKKTKKK